MIRFGNLNEASFFKINYDAALNPTETVLRPEIVITDSSGAVMLSGVKRVKASFSSDITLAQAIHHGMVLPAESSLLPALVESDSFLVINLILLRAPIRSEIGLIIDGILDLQDSFGFINFVFSPRSTNMVAHSLAKMALVHAIDIVLMEEVPPSLSRLVQEKSIFV
ncbi:hypothetical protein ACOSP7_016919 [Xanthoceras sorbifolium]